MSRNFVSSNVICPFYKFENLRWIACEGLNEGNFIELHFESKDDKKEHKARNCERMRESWKVCPIAQMLLKKYE